MSRHGHPLAIAATLLCTSAMPLRAQGDSVAGAKDERQLVPATKMEGFRLKAGTVLIAGFTTTGTVSDVTVRAEEFRGSSEYLSARGLVVEVKGGYRSEVAFVDEEEVDELLHGIDALLAVTVNPTPFENFVMSYSTLGELTLRASNKVCDSKDQPTPGWCEGDRRKIRFLVTAGRVTTASAALSRKDIQDLRSYVDSARAILAGNKPR